MKPTIDELKEWSISKANSRVGCLSDAIDKEFTSKIAIAMTNDLFAASRKAYAAGLKDGRREVLDRVRELLGVRKTDNDYDDYVEIFHADLQRFFTALEKEWGLNDEVAN